MEYDLTKLACRVRELQDRHLATLDPERARRRLLEKSARTGPRRFHRVAITCAVALGTAVLVFEVVRPPTLGFSVGDDRRPGAMGALISTNGHERTPLSFSDGSRIVLSPGARARVTSVDERPHVLLDEGQLAVSVVHRPGRQWRISAGPFEIAVTGTRFEVTWDPSSAAFSVVLSEGRVLVSGPVVGRDRPVQVGETLTVSAQTARFILQAGPPTAVAPIVLPPPPTDPATAVRIARSSRPPRPPSSAPTPPSPVTAEDVSDPPRAEPPAFVSLGRANRYHEALAAAVADGFEDTCARASADDLVLLGDVARLAGDRERARAAYHAVRDRFTGPPAARAAFSLARLLPEDRSYAIQAAVLYEEYLKNAPGGPLEREVIALLAETYHRLRNDTAMRAAAASYLDKYPDGPFAARAKILLERK